MAKKTTGSRAPSRATTRRTEQARRGARPATAGKRAVPAPTRWRLSWARRIGIAGGLLLAVVSVAVAAQKLGPGARTRGGFTNRRHSCEWFGRRRRTAPP